jgi:hypothetical protein
MKRLFVLLPLLLGACAGPKTSQLVEQRHYNEALCSAVAEPEVEPLVADAIVRDLDPKVHVSVFEVDEELHLRAVRVRLATNAIPVDEHAVYAMASSRALDIAAITTLAERTGEKLPHAESPGLLESLLSSRPVYPREPSSTELAAAAPRASRIAKLLDDSCTRAPGPRCSYYFVVAPSAKESLYVDVTVSADAHAAMRCHVERRRRILLGTSETLAHETAQMFGNGFRPLADVSTELAHERAR